MNTLPRSLRFFAATLLLLTVWLVGGRTFSQSYYVVETGNFAVPRLQTGEESVVPLTVVPVQYLQAPSPPGTTAQSLQHLRKSATTPVPATLPTLLPPLPPTAAPVTTAKVVSTAVPRIGTPSSYVPSATVLPLTDEVYYIVEGEETNIGEDFGDGSSMMPAQYSNPPYLTVGPSRRMASGSAVAVEPVDEEFCMNGCTVSLGAFEKEFPWCYGKNGERIRGPASQWLFDNMTVFGGVRLMNDDVNLSHRGSFGTHSGFNWSGPFITPLQLSGQFGFRAVHSNLNQDQLVPENYFRETGVWEPYRNQIRTQYFLTAGLFKRYPNFPLQYGVVYDFCFDDTYQSMRYGQIRAEASVRLRCDLEVGARTAVSAGTHDVPFHYVNFGGETPVESLGEYQLQTSGYTVLFVQKHHDIGANGKIYGGASYRGAFLCGVDYEVPLTNRLTLQSGFSAMFQNSLESVTGARRENWDVYFSLVYYPHGREFNHICNPLRAMFSVADNGSMKTEFVHRRTSVVP